MVFPCVDGFFFYSPGVVKCSSGMILRSEPQAQMKLGEMELKKMFLWIRQKAICNGVK